MAIREFISINLILNILNGDSWICVKTLNLNFIIKVADVSYNRVVLHLGHVMCHNDIFVASSCNKNICGFENTLKSLDLKPFHACL